MIIDSAETSSNRGERGIFRRRAERISTVIPFLLLLACYWSTVPPTVSFWDCPEYVAAAWRLEVGHPPGNPLWMLFHRIVTMAVGSGQYAALAINLSSGMFTALAAMLLGQCVFAAYCYVAGEERMRSCRHSVYAAGGAAVSSLAFGLSDSAWYSAVEAEVYAMSVFLTALMMWLSIRCVSAADRNRAVRLVVLLAYLTGLSVGVHQLNLLILPCMAMIWWSVKGGSVKRGIVLLLLSFIAIVSVLNGIMPGTIYLAGLLELFTVNRLGLPFNSGVWSYLVLLLLASLLAHWGSSLEGKRRIRALSMMPLIFLSGMFLFSHNLYAAVVITVPAALMISFYRHGNSMLPVVFTQSLTVLLIGFSVYLVIPLRGEISSPANAVHPSDPFSLASYIARDQYGASPLLYGPTCFSRRMSLEEIDSTGRAVYNRLAMQTGDPVYAKALPGAVVKSGKLSSVPDSAFNASLANHKGDAYLMMERRVRPKYTPELNMWFPRISGQRPSDIEAYGSWLGMDYSNMNKVRISEAFDSTGKGVTRLDDLGNRQVKYGYRPTISQNLRWFGMYQAGYMYFRYLMWNFSGRQNDLPSTGEVNHGNFITGYRALDNLMLGAEDYLPPEAGSDNRGRNSYYMLPLLLGLFGIISLLCRGGERGRKVCMVIFLMFVMTGPAIVVYLNQTPGEARERDYSFLGSYMAYAAWIGFGGSALGLLLYKMGGRCRARLFSHRRSLALACISLIPGLAVTALMGVVNYDDHDRSRRTVAKDMAIDILNSLDRDAIIFVEGDNFTFPLWYAQEVEGVRRDVTVVSNSYLSLPTYFAAIGDDYDGRKGLPHFYARGQMIYGATRNALISRNAADTLEASEAFRRFYASPTEGFPARNIVFATPGGEMAVSMKEIISENASPTIPFRRLALLETVAANFLRPNPRPVYWQFSAGKSSFAGLKPYTRYTLFAFRLNDGRQPGDSAILDRSRCVRRTGGGKRPYLDYTPETMMIFHRASLTAAALNLLSHGNYRGALELGWLADTLSHKVRYRYGVVSHSDTTFNVADNLSRLLIETGRQCGDSAAVERGREILKEDNRRKRDWGIYRSKLPPRLKGKESI